MEGRNGVGTGGHVLGQRWINDTMLVREVMYLVSVMEELHDVST